MTEAKKKDDKSLDRVAVISSNVVADAEVVKVSHLQKRMGSMEASPALRWCVVDSDRFSHPKKPAPNASEIPKKYRD